MLHRNYTPLSRIIPFPINGDIYQIFPAPLYLTPAEGSPWNFVTAIRQKIRTMPIWQRQKVRLYVHSFWHSISIACRTRHCFTNKN